MSRSSVPNTRSLAGAGISGAPAQFGVWGRRAVGVSVTRVFTGLAPVVLLASMATPVAASAAPPSGETGDAKSVDRDDAAARTSASGTSSAGSSGSPAPSGGTDADRKRVTLDDEFLVEGKLEKPNAFYVLRRSTLGYDWARLDARFSPLVLESVQDPLF